MRASVRNIRLNLIISKSQYLFKTIFFSTFVEYNSYKMSKKNLLSSYSDFEKLTKNSLIDLKEMVDKYPYCQVVQMLFLLNLKKIADPNFDIQLSYTALSVPDRQLLKQHIEEIEKIISKPQMQASKRRAKDISEIPVTVEVKQEEKEAQWDRFAHLGTLTISKLLFDQTQDTSIHSRNTEVSDTGTPLPQKGLDARPKKSQALEDAKARLKEISGGLVGKSDEEVEEPKKEEEAQLLPTVPTSKTTPSKAKVNSKALVVPKKKSTTKAKIKNHELSKEELVERFLAKPDHILITPDNKKDYSYDADINQSLKEDFENGSETLAKLYVSQGAIDKAIEIYKHLSLKYPEKSRFFAKEIREAKKKIIK